MGHENNGEPEFLLEALDFKTHAFPEFGIQVGQRFIQQHDLGISNDGPGQGNPLLLSSGKITGIDFFHPIQTGVMQGLFHPLHDLRLGQFSDLQGKSHIFKDIHMWPDSEGLEHHSQAPFLGRHIDIFIFYRNRTAAQFDFTFRQVFESGNHPQRGAFTAA